MNPINRIDALEKRVTALEAGGSPVVAPAKRQRRCGPRRLSSDLAELAMLVWDTLADGRDLERSPIQISEWNEAILLHEPDFPAVNGELNDTLRNLLLRRAGLKAQWNGAEPLELRRKKEAAQ